MEARKALLAAGGAVLAGISGAVAVSSPAQAAVTCAPIAYSGRTASGLCRGLPSDRAIYRLHIECQSVNVPVTVVIETGNVPVNTPTSGTCGVGFVPSRLFTHYVITRH